MEVFEFCTKILLTLKQNFGSINKGYNRKEREKSTQEGERSFDIIYPHPCPVLKTWNLISLFYIFLYFALLPSAFLPSNLPLKLCLKKLKNI